MLDRQSRFTALAKAEQDLLTTRFIAVTEALEQLNETMAEIAPRYGWTAPATARMRAGWREYDEWNYWTDREPGPIRWDSIDDWIARVLRGKEAEREADHRAQHTPRAIYWVAMLLGVIIAGSVPIVWSWLMASPV